MDSSFSLAIGFVTIFCIICLWFYKKSHAKFQSKESPSSSSTQIVSPPSHQSPPPSRIWTHQVFPSFRGEDVRRGFLSHVQKELKAKGIAAFIDDEMKRSGSIGPELFRAITESKIAIVLLSRNYASSSWCLNELSEIMKCKEEIGQTVMTIFYGVDPSDVRNQTGEFGKAFEKTCVGKTEEVKQRWRRALTNVANILGEDSRNWDREADMIVKIARDVSDVLNYTPSRDYQDYVGMRPHITKMNSFLSLECSDVKMIGILGPPGIGKTTIARVLQRKVNLQRRLLSEIFNQKDLEIRHLGVVQERLKDHKVLVILDGVDQLEQLIAMAKETRWFGCGSRIIVTTQDERLLKAHGINYVYKVNLPSSDKALQIFCLYAFGQKFPNDGFKKLAMEFTELAGELPLGLRVMGSYLRGMSLEEWENALPRLRTSLDGEIGEIERTLRFSYDVLSDKDKAIFLHIACLFHGCLVDHVKQWLANSNLDINHGYEVLTRKSLIFSSMGYVRMHSLLQQLGVDIVRKQSIEPGKRQFLVDADEISDVITDNAGSKTILGIMLNVSKIEEELVIEETVFDGMTNLQFLIFEQCLRDKFNIPLGLNCLPRKLKLLHWDYCPLRFWPSKFSAKFLVEIIMRGSKFEKLWEGIQPLQNLKRMEFSDGRSLKEIPDLSTAINLESLILMFCTSLLEIPSSIGDATSLKKLDIGGCSSLVKLPSSISNIATSLEKLNLSACSQLKTFPEIVTNIQELNLSGSAIKELPSSIKLWSRLCKLEMRRCRSLKMFPHVPDGIEELDLSDTEIEEIPPWIENLSRLRHLTMFRWKKLDNLSLSRISKMVGVSCMEITRGDEHAFSYIEVNIRWVSGFVNQWTLQPEMLQISLPETVYTSPVSLFFIRNDFKTIPDIIKQLPQLRQLSLFECRNLVSLPQLPDSLASLDAKNCVSLETIDGSFRNPEIRLNFLNCISLNQEARELIQLSVCKHALLPTSEVPAHFIHRAIGGSLTICLKDRHLPKFLRFKACLLLIDDGDDDDVVDDDVYDEKVIVYSDYNTYPHSVHYTKEDTMRLSCHVKGKQNGTTFRYGSSVHILPTPRVCTEHVYIFEASFSLEECVNPEADCDLVFDFKVHDYFWEIEECGLKLLDVSHVHEDNRLEVQR
ncbi:unnamed protein product [Cochlearia groenlandica]